MVDVEKEIELIRSKRKLTTDEGMKKISADTRLVCIQQQCCPK